MDVKRSRGFSKCKNSNNVKTCDTRCFIKFRRDKSALLVAFHDEWRGKGNVLPKSVVILSLTRRALPCAWRLSIFHMSQQILQSFAISSHDDMSSSDWITFLSCDLMDSKLFSASPRHVNFACLMDDCGANICDLWLFIDSYRFNYSLGEGNFVRFHEMSKPQKFKQSERYSPPSNTRSQPHQRKAIFYL